MIVVDASAMVVVLVGDPAAASIAAAIRREDVHAPERLMIEVISAQRGLVLRRELAEPRARIAADRLALLRGVAHAVLPLRTRIWALRDQLTAYDAAYLALAEAIGGEITTLDVAVAKLARRRGVLREVG